MSPNGHLLFGVSLGIWDIYLQCDRWFQGGGCILWMTGRSDLVIWPRSMTFEFATTAPMKSSKYIKMLYIESYLMIHLGLFYGGMNFSKTWCERASLISMSWWMISCLILVATQNYATLSDHPFVVLMLPLIARGCLVDFSSCTKNSTCRLPLP